MQPVILSGSYYEQGVQHGRQLRSHILSIVEERFQYRPQWDMARVTYHLSLLQTNMEKFCPWLIEEMHGIAEGAELSYDDIFTYNCIADISLINIFCSNIAFQDTSEGPALGKTNDVGKDTQRYHVLLQRTGGDGQPLLWVTWPGTIWANCFVNGAGFCYGGASVKKVARNEEGIPSNVLQRVIADKAATVPEAISLMQETPIMHHPLNATLADAEGNIAVVEKAPDGCDVRLPEGQKAIFATNHFNGPTLAGTDSEGYSAYDSHGVAGYEQFKDNSRARFKKLEQLAASGEHSVERLKTILADHTEPVGICQHGYLARPGYEGMWTTTAYVAVPRTRTLHFAFGRPCETEFKIYSL